MSALTQSERALLFCLRTAGAEDVLDHAPVATRRHLRHALAADDSVPARSTAAARLRAALPKDRRSVQAIRSDLPSHWRRGLDRVARGEDGEVEEWIATLLMRRLQDRLDLDDAVLLDFDLASHCREPERFWGFIHTLGLEALGLVAQRLDRRRRARLLRDLDDDERPRVRDAAARDADDALAKLVSDAFVQLAEVEPVPARRCEDLGLYLLAFGFADDRNAGHRATIVDALEGRQRNRFQDFVSAARSSSRRHLADDVLAFIAHAETR